jgi:hypothetical protein
LRKDRTARPLFHRVIHKKSGALRPHWAYWVADGVTRSALSAPSAKDAPTTDPSDGEKPGSVELALRQLRPFAQTVADWRRDTPPPPLLATAAIVDRLTTSKGAGLVLACSHDNYRQVAGGVQLCIQREEQAAIARGLDYLQFHPWQPLPCLAPEGDGAEVLVTLVLNGKPVGTASMAVLTDAISHVVASGRPVRLILHQLLGHSPEAIAALWKVAKVKEVPFWLHDFLSLCPGYTLLRNGLTFCGAPNAGSNACGICVFGAARAPHCARIAALFQAVPVVVVAPSQVTADFWLSRSDLPVVAMHTIPHVILDERSRAIAAPVDDRAPVTVGYLGATFAHKGWPIFEDIMIRHSGPRTRFVVLSDKRPGLGEDDWHYVHVTAETPDAMSRAVESAGVDVILHWASWPETFSFTTFEALAAGAFVLTNSNSGNVQAAVHATGRGRVLEDVAALDRLFADGGLARLVAERRAIAARTEIVARYSSLTFDLAGWN